MLTRLVGRNLERKGFSRASHKHSQKHHESMKQGQQGMHVYKIGYLCWRKLGIHNAKIAPVSDDNKLLQLIQNNIGPTNVRIIYIEIYLIVTTCVGSILNKLLIVLSTWQMYHYQNDKNTNKEVHEGYVCYTYTIALHCRLGPERNCARGSSPLGENDMCTIL